MWLTLSFMLIYVHIHENERHRWCNGFSLLALSAIHCGFNLKTITLVFVASPLSMQNKGERAMTH